MLSAQASLLPCDTDGQAKDMAFFTDSEFHNLYWQAAESGTVFVEYNRVELRFVQCILAGEDDREFAFPNPRVSLTLVGERMGCPSIHLEFDTTESRDEILDGLRVLRCGASMLFTQWTR